MLLEPIAKNTAPALTIAALEAVEKGLDPILFATPTDQAIQGAVEFQNAASKAIHSASENNIVIMGIRPTKPDVSFGYIKINSNSGPDLANVEHFVEKPSMSLAESYLNSGSYFWNSGIVVIRASLWLRAIQYFDNNLYQCARNAFIDRTVEGNFTKMKLEKI